MTLLQLVAGFARRHWRAYASAALMLLGIAVMTVWIPRRVGHIIDGLVGRRPRPAPRSGASSRSCSAMGAGIYLLRVGWRLAALQRGVPAGRRASHAALRATVAAGARVLPRRAHGRPHGARDQRRRRGGDGGGRGVPRAFDGTLTLVLVVAMMTLGVDWRLGLVALLPFPFMAYAFFVISRPRARRVATLARPLLRAQRARAGDRRRRAHAARAGPRGPRRPRTSPRARATPPPRGSRRSGGSRRTSPRSASR